MSTVYDGQLNIRASHKNNVGYTHYQCVDLIF
jgi:hypothetical protein